MRRISATLALVLLLVAVPSYGVPNPSDPPVETTRSTALRAVYFPFLVVGHGLLLIAKYGVAYPVYFVFKPVYDTLYESSEDPTKMDTSSSNQS